MITRTKSSIRPEPLETQSDMRSRALTLSEALMASSALADTDAIAALVAFYVRVSTGRQAAGDLSVPDQIARLRAYCEQRNWRVVEIYVEAASGTDDNRPEFTRLMQTATLRPRPYDVVLVHSLSRLARDVVTVELAVRRLARVGTRLVSITQETSDDPTGALMRKIIAMFDEHQSAENAKHTSRAMIENARQGFFNGSVAPFGFRVTEVGQRGARMKKTLEVEPAEATVVARIHAMCLGREGGTVMGLKRIVERLHSEGLTLRGKPFRTSTVHRILTSEAYTGTIWYNRICARTGAERPREEWVAITVPEIVSREDFDRVQAILAARAPSKTAPRVTTSPVLLTGLARCATCGGGMTLRTGKSGRYRYYTCASAAHSGRTVCRGRSLPMESLDEAVVEVLADTVLKPERLRRLLDAYIARSTEGAAARRERLAQAQKKATEAAGTKVRLLQLVATGALDAEDPQLTEELKRAEARRQRAAEEIALLENEGKAATPRAITPAKIERLGTVIRDALKNGPPEFRRAYVRQFVREVVVDDDEIRVSGPTTALAAASAKEEADADLNQGSQIYPEWRPVRDSNPCCQRERLVS